MEYRFPHYFEDFQCTASACEDTCCAGWAIMIDDDSLEKYEKMDGPFGNRLHNSIDWKEGCFIQCNKRCAFLNDDNLCDIHIEAGEEMLCDTCKNYPRHLEEYEGLREGSLSLSCIEAAKLILGCTEPVQFLDLEDETEDEEFEGFDYLLFTKLMDARTSMIKVLQNRSVDIMTRMGMVLELADKMQTALDRNEICEMDAILEEFGKMDQLIVFQKRAENEKIGENEYCSIMRKFFRIIYKLEVLKSDWPEYAKRAEVTLYGQGQSAYENNRQRFHKGIGLRSANYDIWSNWLEQLMVYFVFTYFCGAVYDDKILAKMQMAIISVLFISELSIAKWVEQGEKIDFNTFVDIAHRVSREIEHSDVNLNRLEKLGEITAFLQPEVLMKLLMFA